MDTATRRILENDHELFDAHTVVEYRVVIRRMHRLLTNVLRVASFALGLPAKEFALCPSMRA
jgi:hypothetical protein